MFGFGKAIEVVPVSFHEGYLRFRSPKKMVPGKTVKVKVLLLDQAALTLSVKIAESEEEEGLYTCLALVKEREAKVQEAVLLMAFAGVEGACRRQTRRIPATIRIRSRQLPNYRGITANVNETGVELHLDTLLTVGTPLSLEFDVPEMDGLQIQAESIWTTDEPVLGKSTYRAGVAFIERDPNVLSAWSAYYRRILDSDGASVMLKTMGDGSDSSLRESQKLAAQKQAGRVPGIRDSGQFPALDSGLHQTVSGSYDSGGQSLPPGPPPPPPPSPVSKPPSFAPPSRPVENQFAPPPFGSSPGAQPSQFPPASPVPGFGAPAPPFGSQSNQPPAFPSPSHPPQFNQPARPPMAPPFGTPPSNNPFGSPPKPNFQPPQQSSSPSAYPSDKPKRLTLDHTTPGQSPSYQPPSPPYQPPSPSGGGVFSPGSQQSPAPLSFNPPPPPGPPSFAPSGGPSAPPFGSGAPNSGFMPPAPPSFQPPSPPSSLNFSPPTPGAPIPFGQPVVGPAFGAPPPPERVTPMRMAGENIMFNCLQGERYPDGAQVKVELAFQIQGQMKSVTVTVGINGKQRNADGSYTCIGVVREDRQRIEILNQLLG